MDELKSILLDQTRRTREDILKQIGGIQTRCNIIIGINGVILTLVINFFFDNENRTTLVSQVANRTIPYTQTVFDGNSSVIASLVVLIFFIAISIIFACRPLLLDFEISPVDFNPLNAIEFHSGDLIVHKTMEKLVHLTEISKVKNLAICVIAYRWFRVSIILFLMAILGLIGLFAILITSSLYLFFNLLIIANILIIFWHKGLLVLREGKLQTQIRLLELEEAKINRRRDNFQS